MANALEQGLIMIMKTAVTLVLPIRINVLVAGPLCDGPSYQYQREKML